jgi:hypothetical protein
MQLDPLVSQARHSPFRQAGVIQRLLAHGRPSHEPLTPVAARGFVHLRRMDAQPDELPPHHHIRLPITPKRVSVDEDACLTCLTVVVGRQKELTNTV